MVPSTAGPALTPSGFDAGNTWGTFGGGASDTLNEINSSWGSTAGSISYMLRLNNTGDSTQTGIFANTIGGATIFGGSFNDSIATFARNNGSLGINIDGNQLTAATGTILTGQ